MYNVVSSPPIIFTVPILETDPRTDTVTLKVVFSVRSVTKTSKSPRSNDLHPLKVPLDLSTLHSATIYLVLSDPPKSYGGSQDMVADTLFLRMIYVFIVTFLGGPEGTKRKTRKSIQFHESYQITDYNKSTQNSLIGT